MLISVNDYVVIIKENESNSSFDSDVARYVVCSNICLQA